MTCVSTQFCFNLKRGYCGWNECPHSHNVFSKEMGDSVYNLMKHGAVWINLGKSRIISDEIRKKIVDKIGEFDRIDFVEMPGNPEKGGPYWCAVVFFNSVKHSAKCKLLSGNCVWIKDGMRQIRVTLFRSEVKPKEIIKAKLQAKKATIQAQLAVIGMQNSLSCLGVE